MRGGTAAWDVIIIGSGINALVCGAMLSRKGKRVLLLERNAVAGGCIRTEELTQPSFLHDTLSTLYPLFVTAPHFPQLEPELARHGARFVNTTTPTAVLLPDGRSLIFGTDRAANAASLERCAVGDGDAYRRAMAEIEAAAPITFGLLGNELWSAATAKLLARQSWARGPRNMARFFQQGLGSCRDWLEANFRSDEAKALFAPWVLHVGLAPESAMSGHMGKLIMFTLEQAGSPMVAGGSAKLVEAFRLLIAEAGGAIRTNAEVDEVLVSGKRVRGVRLSNGEQLEARSAVVASVTPGQLYVRLLRGAPVADEVRRDARRFRFGRGEMQIHLALSEKPKWPDPKLLDVGMLHVTPGLDGVSRAVNEAERGLLPEAATIVVAQPLAIDPSRAPDGKWILWIQLQELPREGQLRGDAAGTIEVGADGRWTPAVREAYADRIVERLGRQIPNLKASIIGRHVISPADLANININLVDGDPYSGDCSLDQFMLWRPSPSGRNHETGVKGLFHIGASTHPGPGLGGMSGYMAAGRIG